MQLHFPLISTFCRDHYFSGAQMMVCVGWNVPPICAEMYQTWYLTLLTVCNDQLQCVSAKGNFLLATEVKTGSYHMRKLHSLSTKLGSDFFFWENNLKVAWWRWETGQNELYSTSKYCMWDYDLWSIIYLHLQTNMDRILVDVWGQHWAGCYNNVHCETAVEPLVTVSHSDSSYITDEEII